VLLKKDGHSNWNRGAAFGIVKAKMAEGGGAEGSEVHRMQLNGHGNGVINRLTGTGSSSRGAVDLDRTECRTDAFVWPRQCMFENQPSSRLAACLGSKQVCQLHRDGTAFSSGSGAACNDTVVHTVGTACVHVVGSLNSTPRQRSCSPAT
jgi:hypothetical protein